MTKIQEDYAKKLRVITQIALTDQSNELPREVKPLVPYLDHRVADIRDYLREGEEGISRQPVPSPDEIKLVASAMLFTAYGENNQSLMASTIALLDEMGLGKPFELNELKAAFKKLPESVRDIQPNLRHDVLLTSQSTPNDTLNVDEVCKQRTPNIKSGKGAA